MLELAKITARLKGGAYDNALIINAQWKKEECTPNKVPDIVKETSKYLICKACIGEASLTTRMFLTGKATEAEADIPSRLNEDKPWRSFNRDEVISFVSEVGDTNPIHQTHKPIVPGMMLMNYIKNELPANTSRIELSFRQAVYAGDKLFLKASEGIILLYGRNIFIKGKYE